MLDSCWVGLSQRYVVIEKDVFRTRFGDVRCILFKRVFSLLGKVLNCVESSYTCAIFGVCCYLAFCN